MTNTAYLGGATDKSVTLTGFTASTGVPYTAGAYNTAGITAKYRRAGANAEATITLATQTVSGAHSDGGFVHISGGRYRLDLPDAAIAAGSDYVDIWVYGITDTFFTTARIDILAGDPRSATVDANVTQISGDSTAADNAELFFDGTGYAGGTTKLQVNATYIGSQTASASGTITFPNATLASTTNITAASGVTVSALGANVITAAATASDFGAEIADAVWDEAMAGHVAAGSAGEALGDGYGTITGLSFTLESVILETVAVGSTGNDTTHVHLPALTYGDDEINNYVVTFYDVSEDEKHVRYITDWVNATKLATLNEALPVTPQNATDGVWLMGAKVDTSGGGLDAAGVRSAIGMASANFDTKMNGIEAKVDVVDGTADSILINVASTIPGTLTSMDAKLNTIDDFLDTEVAAIKAKTDNLPSDPADASVVAGLIAAAEAKIDTIDTVVDAIKLQTDNLPSDPADASVVAGLIAAVSTKIDAVDDYIDTEVAAIKAKTDSLTFTTAGLVDANIQQVNNTTVLGDGAGTPWGP